jgi:DNA-binding GntR family transcriptional regulator
VQAHAAVFDKYFRYLILALSFRGDVVPRQHQQLLECALRRDAARAKTVLTAHITECVDHAIATGQLP